MTMKQEPLISVIVPIYNVEKYLRQCIDSLIGQTYNNLEIILVDDGSTDNCPEICDNYANQRENIKIIHKPNGGLISARKSGINASSGKYIGYVDGDDWVLKNHFENIAKVIMRDDPDIIVHGYTVYGKKSEKKPPENFQYKYYNREKIEENIIPAMFSVSPFYTPGIVPSVWGKIFRRELILPIQNNVPNEISIGEDAAVSYPSILCSNSIEFIDDCEYMYRTNASSMTHTYDKKLTTRLPVLIKYLSESMRIKDQTSHLYKGFMDYVCFMTLGTISNEICGSENIRFAISKLQVIADNDLIIEAVNRKETPTKVKIAYQIVKNRQYLIASGLKKIWSR